MLKRIQSRRVFFLVLAVFCCGMFFTSSSHSEENNSVTILYTGSIGGNYAPVRG